MGLWHYILSIYIVLGTIPYCGMDWLQHGGLGLLWGDISVVPILFHCGVHLDLWFSTFSMLRLINAVSHVVMNPQP